MAIASIGLTSRLKSYLHMNEGLNMPPRHNNLKASRTQFKYFLELLSHSKLAFFVLQYQSLIQLSNLWNRERKPDSIPPNFEDLLDQVIGMVN